MTAWTREAIADLKEDDLSRDVLLPLFQAMGYRDVRFFGGGALEQGKDIVMWRDEPIRGRVNIAVVVKAVPITGEAVTGRVIDQLRQAFGKPFLDTATHVEQKVSECFVVTPREVKKEGTNTLEGLLENERFRDYVTIIDGVRLWALIEEYLGARLAIPKLLEAYQQLSDAVPSHGIKVSLAGQAAAFEVVGPELNEQPPVIEPAFPATPEGSIARAEFDRFVRTGEPTEIPLSDIKGIPIPEFMETLGVDTTKGIVRLSNVRPRGVIGSLRLLAKDGDTAVFDHVEFTVTAGAEQLRLSNQEQGLPFAFALVIAPNDAGVLAANIEYNFNITGSTAHWALLQQRALRVMSKGFQFILKDLQTGIELPLGTANPGLVKPSSPEFITLIEEVAWIEDRTKEPIIMPRREFFTLKDRENIAYVRAVLMKGQYNLTALSFHLQPHPEHRNAVIDMLRKGKGPLRLEQEDSAWPVLETPVRLGPMHIEATAAAVASDVPLDEAVRAIESGGTVKIRLERSPKHRMLARFPRWRKRS